MRASALWIGVVTTASASVADGGVAAHLEREEQKADTATVPSSTIARIFTFDPRSYRTQAGMATFFSRSSSSSTLPVPSATQDSGSSPCGDGQVRLLPQQMIETAQQRAAAGEHDALVDDVRRQLRRRPLQTRAHRFHDGHHRLAQRLADLLVGDHDGLRDPVDQVAPLDLHRPPLAAHRIGRAERRS